jgi:glycosyltransferase involved in cell wall biosynthesis
MANHKLINGLKEQFHCPFFLILWDLFPQNAKDLGLIKNSIVFNYFKAQEKKNLSAFNYIGCMSKGNKEYVNKNYQYIDKNSLLEFPLWSKIKEKKDIDVSLIRKKYDLELKDFILVFGGNMGKPQSLENVIDLAKEVNLLKDIKFLFVGQGTEVSRLKEKVHNYKLHNVIFKDFIPREDYENLIGACDVGIVSLDKRFTIPNFPSKTMDYLKLSLPILASLDRCAMNDYGSLLENEMKAGLCSEALDMDNYKRNLIRLYEDKEFYMELSINGRKYYEHAFNVENNYKRIKNILGIAR